ncbi:uncharacterized protein LOC115700069 [Cannabis sativa]|uniref:uncharacterized protein LOC115700069 n=1 Tax=Cannabis sativa TaxID=3483 RepID=UPI0029CA3BB2|nr:uncharacterized protein LOC115700069 [Cannabis sativa]
MMIPFPTHIFLSSIKFCFVIIPTTMWNYMVLCLDHLTCAFEILLYNQFSFPEPNIDKYYSANYNNNNSTTIPNKPVGSEMRVTRFECSEGKDVNDGDEVVECAVCLCEVKEGDEIGELRCCHVLHFRCLEKWVVRSKQMTCPVCRGTTLPANNNNNGVQLLYFYKFCSFTTNNTSSQHHERDSWWLR